MDEGKARQVAREIASQFMLEGGIYCAELTEAITSALLSIAADEREECAKVAEKYAEALSNAHQITNAQSVRAVAAAIRSRHPRVPSSPIEGGKGQ
jgi:hypothetical protein